MVGPDRLCPRRRRCRGREAEDAGRLRRLRRTHADIEIRRHNQNLRALRDQFLGNLTCLGRIGLRIAANDLYRAAADTAFFVYLFNSNKPAPRINVVEESKAACLRFGHPNGDGTARTIERLRRCVSGSKGHQAKRSKRGKNVAKHLISSQFCALSILRRERGDNRGRQRPLGFHAGYSRALSRKFRWPRLWNGPQSRSSFRRQP